MYVDHDEKADEGRSGSVSWNSAGRDCFFQLVKLGLLAAICFPPGMYVFLVCYTDQISFDLCRKNDRRSYRQGTLFIVADKQGFGAVMSPHVERKKLSSAHRPLAC